MVRIINFDAKRSHGKIVGVFTNDRHVIRFRVISTRVLVCFCDRLMGAKNKKPNNVFAIKFNV